MGKEPEELGNEWVELLVTTDEFYAGMIRDLLQSGEIPVLCRSARSSPYPVNIGRLGEIKLLVRTDDLAMAKELVASTNPPQ